MVETKPVGGTLETGSPKQRIEFQTALRMPRGKQPHSAGRLHTDLAKISPYLILLYHLLWQEKREVEREEKYIFPGQEGHKAPKAFCRSFVP